MHRTYNLEERLINFAALVIGISEALPRTVAGKHISSQLVRSGTSPALHYGEAQAAESVSDFIHKMKVCLKELRETYNCLRLIDKMNWCAGQMLELTVDESNQLIAIFCTSVATARKKLNSSHKPEREK